MPKPDADEQLLAPPPSRASPELQIAPEEGRDAPPAAALHSKSAAPSPDAAQASPVAPVVAHPARVDEVQVSATHKAVVEDSLSTGGVDEQPLTVELESPNVTMRPSVLGSDVGYGAATPL